MTGHFTSYKTRTLHELATAPSTTRIPEQIAWRVCGRADFRLGTRFLLSVASASSFLCIRLHGRRVWVWGFATTASPVPEQRTWGTLASWSGGWRQIPKRCGISRG